MGFWDSWYGKAIDPVGIFGDGWFGGGGNEMGMSGSIEELINKYSYKPQFTAQTEKSLYDLFQQLTGQGGGGVEAIPFDIGLPTTGLYDAVTRQEREGLFGMPGAGQGGKLDDLNAYYNNLGIPEQALQASRNMVADWDRYALDQAARLNESQKDRLLNVLNVGSGVGSNLYGQNLGQHRFNAGLTAEAAFKDADLQDAINQSNFSQINDLLGSAGYLGGTFTTKNPYTSGDQLYVNQNPNAPTKINRSGNNSGTANMLGGY